MNWQHMIYFRTVAKTQNYARAAEELYITTSALSKAIRNLEDEIGFPLFQKFGRNSQLTPYGRSFYECVCEASDNIDQCIQGIHEKMSVVNGNIRIYGIYTMCAEYLPHQIKAFKEKYPQITIDMEYRTTDAILKALLERTIDLGFCGNYDEAQKSYQSLERILIKEEELIILVPQGHPLAQKKTVRFEQLRGESFVVHKHRLTGTGSVFVGLCQKHGFLPHIEFEVPDDQSIMGLVRNGLGIALIADSPSLKVEGTATVRLKGDRPVRDQYMVWRRDDFATPVATAFRGQIAESLPARQNGGDD